METGQGGGRWSVGDVQSAVVAALMLRAGEVDSGISAMRFTDLRDALDRMETSRRVAPKTLATALQDLVARRRLVKNRSGREAWYSLAKLPRGELIPIIAETDRAAILAASQIGAIGDAGRAWAFYGIPEVIKHRLRPSLHAAADAYRDRVGRIFNKELQRFVGSVLHAARGRLTTKELHDAERGIWQGLLQAQAYGGASATLVLLDQISPGAAGRVATQAQARWPSTRDAQIRYLARATGKPEASIERSVQLAERSAAASRRLFSVLPAADRKRFALEFGAWSQLIASWCAVVR